MGGNPNLLWAPVERRLHIIDHNLAFDAHDLDLYIASHAFREAGVLWTPDFRRIQSDRLRWAAEQLDRIWAEMPESWTGPGCDITFETVHALLWRFETEPDRFWQLPS